MAREGLMDDCGYDVYVDEDAWNDGFKAGFLRAIDEFAKALLINEVVDKSVVRRVAEQLKEE